MDLTTTLGQLGLELMAGNKDYYHRIGTTEITWNCADCKLVINADHRDTVMYTNMWQQYEQCIGSMSGDKAIPCTVDTPISELI